MTRATDDHATPTVRTVRTALAAPASQATPATPATRTGRSSPAYAVEESARGRVVTDAPLSRPVPVVLRYDAGFSPATVRFVFPGDIEWSFPRALLETGLRGPTRRGDIEVWPCGRVQTVVEFHSVDGVAVVQFDTTALTRFLRHTYAATASRTTR